MVENGFVGEEQEEGRMVMALVVIVEADEIIMCYNDHFAPEENDRIPKFY
ncbi:hypothetical protein Hanom_Chr06g00551501 [Helianthus anomalus]